MDQTRHLVAVGARCLVAVVAGLAAVVYAHSGPMPGNGTFLLAAGLAGIVAGLVAPSRIGWVCLVGAIAAAVLVPAAGEGYSGLWALVIGALAVPATAGWLAGYAAVRAHRLGLRGAVRDPAVLGAVAGVLAILGLIWYLAASFATSPP
jgi:hypothetical protein